MLTPTTKAPGMEAAIEEQYRSTGWSSRKESIEKGVCVQCGQPAKDFREEKCVREYQISGLCQTCQDEIFTPGGEDGQT